MKPSFPAKVTFSPQYVMYVAAFSLHYHLMCGAQWPDRLFRYHYCYAPYNVPDQWQLTVANNCLITFHCSHIALMFTGAQTTYYNLKLLQGLLSAEQHTVWYHVTVHTIMVLNGIVHFGVLFKHFLISSILGWY